MCTNMSENCSDKKIIDGRNSNKINPNDDEEILKNKAQENNVEDEKDDSRKFENGNEQETAGKANNTP